MNKRIQKLFNEAGFHQPEMERLGIEDKFEKFAELNVRDCASQIDTFVAMNVPPVLLSSRLRKQYIKDESSKEL